MKTLLLCATLAASSLVPVTAAAWPGRPDTPTAGDPPPTEPGWRTDRDGSYDRYDRFDRPNRADRFEDRWMALSSFTPAQQGKSSVRLSGRERKLDRLRLEAVRGSTTFRDVTFEYANGSHERIALDTTLTQGQDKVVSIPGDRRITRLTITTDRHSSGAYSLYAD